MTEPASVDLTMPRGRLSVTCWPEILTYLSTELWQWSGGTVPPRYIRHFTLNWMNT